MKPKISIIIPVYNVEKYLAKCLDSIINQSLKELEIICVDDGSTDKSDRILDEYAKKDERIKIITKENGGLSSARNEGLKHATAEYVAFVDSDDWVELECYERALGAMQSSNADYVMWGVKAVYDDVAVNKVENIDEYLQSKFSGYKKLDDDIVFGTIVTAWNKLYKMKIIKENKLIFPHGLLFEDNEFFLKYVLHSKSAYYLDEQYYNYLQRSGSIMHKIRAGDNRALDRIEIFKNIYNYYKTHKLVNEHRELLARYFYDFVGGAYYNCASKFLAYKSIFRLIFDLDNEFLNYALEADYKLPKRRTIKRIIRLKKLLRF